MSADLLDGEDEKGTIIGAEMSVHNVLTLTLFSNHDRDPDEQGPDTVDLVLLPNESGLALARRISETMQNWITHVEGT